MEDVEKLGRLTDREKECLRQWLQHKTAKEIAVELGISHHAVEKRLKMARTKLDVASSLQAARMLGEAEGYGQTASQSPDLPTQAPKEHIWFARPLTLGVTVMSILAAASLVLALQTSGAEGAYGALPGSGAGPNTGYRGYSAEDVIMPSEGEVAAITRETFDYLDENNSGFLEGRESPVSPPSNPQPVDANDENGNRAGSEDGQPMTPKEATDGFYELADTDGDGRVSYPEYHEWARVPLERFGIPAEWQENLNTAPAT